MSTKIYDGLISTETNVWETVKRIRGVIEPMFVQRFDAAVKLAEEHDGESWKEVFSLYMTGKLTEKWDKPIKYSLWDTPQEVYDLIRELQKCPLRTFSELDFGYDIVLLENGLGKTLPPLVLCFSERAGVEYRDALKAEGIVEEYGYWDNTDRPDDLSKYDWNKRRKAWSFLDVPADEGVRIDLPSRDYFVARHVHRQVEPLIG